MDAATVIPAAVLLIGLGLLVFEAFMPGAYMLIPGLVMTAVGVFGLVDNDEFFTAMTPAVAIIAAIIATPLTFWMYAKLGAPEPPTTTVAESLVGRKGTVTVAVSIGNMKGKVRIGNDVWSAQADEEIPEGTEVIVDSSEGVHVHVVRA